MPVAVIDQFVGAQFDCLCGIEMRTGSASTMMSTPVAPVQVRQTQASFSSRSRAYGSISRLRSTWIILATTHPPSSA
jgi:hypothetical protein